VQLRVNEQFKNTPGKGKEGEAASSLKKRIALNNQTIVEKDCEQLATGGNYRRVNQGLALGQKDQRTVENPGKKLKSRSICPKKRKILTLGGSFRILPVFSGKKKRRS